MIEFENSTSRRVFAYVTVIFSQPTDLSQEVFVVCTQALIG